MSNSSLISYTRISPNKTSPRNHEIDTVTVHCYVGQVSVEDMADWLCNPEAGASANYGIGSDGRIGLFVDEGDRSWCSSNKANDHRAITIECASDKTHPYAINDKVYASLINLLVDICKRNGIDALRWQADKSLIGQVGKQNMTVHRWFAAKACPGDYLYSRHGQIAAEVNAQLKGESGADAGTGDKWYRVRKSWEDSDSQLGAYEILENAIADCPPGYSVYDENGKVVYTAKSKGFQASSLKGLTEAERIAKIAPLYVESAKTTGMLPSVGIAQFCLESGYGTTDLAEFANNLHGMKCSLSGNTWDGSVWDGKSKYGKYSPEVENGVTVQRYSEFRKYPCCEDSITDRAAYFANAMNGSKKRYPGIVGETNYRKAVQIIKDGAYATDPNYVSKLCNLIERWDLAQYDGDAASGGVDILPETPEPWYRVRISWGTDMTGQIGAYHDLEKAKALADKNPGYFVFNEDGQAIYPKTGTGSVILQQCAKFQAQLETDIAAGKNWEYHNPSKYLEEQWSNALKNNKRACNCALLARWALKEARLIPQTTGIFYGKLGGTIQWGKGTKEAVTATCDLISVQNRTVQQLISDGTLQPGDIVTYVNLQHTNIYAGNGIWYDAGHAYCNGSGEGAIFNSWYGDGKYNNQKVGYIIRPKAVQGEQTGECKYIVQAGAYTKRSNAEARVEKLKAAGFDVFIKFEDNFYKIQAGAYEKKENAEKQVAALKAAGFTAFIR